MMTPIYYHRSLIDDSISLSNKYNVFDDSFVICVKEMCIILENYLFESRNSTYVFKINYSNFDI